MTPPSADGEIRQLLVHPAVWTRLERWLAAQNIDIDNVGVLTEGDLPTYVMRPKTLAPTTEETG
ncbi:hypothetical protein ACFCX0_03690 [Streptomyces sp. NPDC056352]|uniref:hypothetical protein n=1 Tax=Streptomyces sp. NPDC056352 TaxID=3345791 RepID=UPI0035D82423